MKSAYTITEAKAQLSKLLAQVERGETISIARGRTVIACLVPANQPQTLPPRELGAWQGQVWEAPNCWDDDPQMAELFAGPDEIHLAAESVTPYGQLPPEPSREVPGKDAPNPGQLPPRPKP
jgi:antitoxin (DNA-binding transcriptional repressor) of toxin-antitoxin stability system